jgi:hypothetical protein
LYTCANPIPKTAIAVLTEAYDIVYRKLQKHLDKMPVGYPATASGVELRLSKFLFTPKQARIALELDYSKVQTSARFQLLIRSLMCS